GDRPLALLRPLRRDAAGRVRARGHGPRDLRLRVRRVRRRGFARRGARAVARVVRARASGAAGPAPRLPHDARRAGIVRAVRVPADARSLALPRDPPARCLHGSTSRSDAMTETTAAPTMERYYSRR